MPGFKQKFADFIQKLAQPPENETQGSGGGSSIRRKSRTKSVDLIENHTRKPNSAECFIQKYLTGQQGNDRVEPKIIHGRTPQQLLPSKPLGTLSKPVLSAMTGPNGGLTTVNKKRRHLSISDPDLRFIDTAEEEQPGSKDANSNTSNINCNLPGAAPMNPLMKCESTPNAYTDLAESGDPIAGVVNWEVPTSSAYGRSVSLYERHPITGVPAGEPIADCFAVVSRANSAILCLADGVNWGPKASLAARAAVHGCIDYLNQAVYNHKLNNTMEVFVTLLRSFHAAHNLILEENGMLTTLTAVLVLPLVAPANKYVACACNVGDSLAYVYSPKHGVREITQGSHDVHRMRDMRDALGALGPVDGTNPELANLTCALTEVDIGDIVFITSDGVSDNLDPVVGKFTGLNGVQAEQRHKLGLLRTEDLLKNGVSGKGPPAKSAKTVVELMIDFVTRLTSAKRHLLEDHDLYPKDAKDPEASHRAKRKQMCDKLAAVPGKLDHATVVAYKVQALAAPE